MPTLIHDLLELPASVRKGDFVQGLADGIARPEATMRDYAIPPKMVQSFQHALSILKDSLADGRSKAAYLDGSFGSGKSHFMAVLALMLMDNPLPWGRAELHALRAAHPWVGQKKLEPPGKTPHGADRGRTRVETHRQPLAFAGTLTTRIRGSRSPATLRTGAGRPGWRPWVTHVGHAALASVTSVSAWAARSRSV